MPSHVLSTKTQNLLSPTNTATLVDCREQRSTTHGSVRAVELYRAAVVAITAALAAAAWQAWRRYGATVAAVLTNNQALMLLVSSACIASVTRACYLLQQKIEERLWTTITVKSSETAVFNALIAHLVKHRLLSSSVLTAKKKKATKRKSWRQAHLDWMLGKNELELEYTPGDNCAGIVPWKGSNIIITRSPDGPKQCVGWARHLVQPEVMRLRTWGQDGAVLRDFLQSAVATATMDVDDEINIMCIGNDWPGGWQKAVTKKRRALESVVLDGDLQQRLLADAKEFLRSGNWYSQAGIPYRRGYLLYGPPGCGKTSFCQALAGTLKLDVCMLSLSNKGMTDNDLAAHLRDAPANAIVLLEDVDAVFHGRELTRAGSGGDDI